MWVVKDVSREAICGDAIWWSWLHHAEYVVLFIIRYSVFRSTYIIKKTYGVLHNCFLVKPTPILPCGLSTYYSVHSVWSSERERKEKEKERKKRKENLVALNIHMKIVVWLPSVIQYIHPPIINHGRTCPFTCSRCWANLQTWRWEANSNSFKESLIWECSCIAPNPPIDCPFNVSPNECTLDETFLFLPLLSPVSYANTCQ